MHIQYIILNTSALTPDGGLINGVGELSQGNFRNALRLRVSIYLYMS